MRRLPLLGLLSVAFLFLGGFGANWVKEARVGLVPPSLPIKPAALTLAAPSGFSLPDDLGRDLGEEIRCLALNIYFEARSEPLLGQLAVAKVTMNRVAHKAFPGTICDVVRQGGSETLHRCQFSWYCNGKENRPRNRVAWRRAQEVAYRVLFGGAPDPTHGALWYHADYVKPGWADAMTRTRKIGRHIYYVSG